MKKNINTKKLKKMCQKKKKRFNTTDKKINRDERLLIKIVKEELSMKDNKVVNII